MCTRHFLFFTALLLWLTSCHNLNDYTPPESAKNAYERHWYKSKGKKSEKQLSESSAEDLLLDIPQAPYPRDWDRGKYESVDMWVDRIQLELEVGGEEIRELREKFQELEGNEKQLTQKIEGYLEHNEKVKAALDYVTEESFDGKEGLSEESFRFYEKPPFLIHLVRPNETLHSISMNYYGTADRVNDIMLWNQGWIEHPRSLKAGLALALFFDFEKSQGEKVVDEYIQTLMSEE